MSEGSSVHGSLAPRTGTDIPKFVSNVQLNLLVSDLMVSRGQLDTLELRNASFWI